MRGKGDDLGRRAALVFAREVEAQERLGAALPFLKYDEVRMATHRDEALAQLDDAVGLVLCEPQLDGALDIFDAANRLAPTPRLIALVSGCPRALVFDLRSHGVTSVLDEPPEVNAVREALDRAADAVTALERLARASVGAVGIKQAQKAVRTSMFLEAFARTDGNRHAAARLLQVDRRVVQIMANTFVGKPGN